MIANLKPHSASRSTGLAWTSNAPTSWKVVPLRSIITSRSVKGQTDLPLLSVAREKGVFVRALDGSDGNHNMIPTDLRPYKVARMGDLVINKMKAWQGSMGIAPTDGVVSPAYYVYKLEFASHQYAESLLRSKPYVAEFARSSDGVRIGQWDLSIPRMREIPILVPPPNEQEAIVRFLQYANRRIDCFVRSKRKLIALLEEQKRAIVNQVATRGLNSHVALTPSGIAALGDIPAQWQMTPLKTVAKIQSGVTLGKAYGNRPRREYPYLRVANVQSGRLDLRTVKRVSVPPTEAARSTLRPGDVLMTEGGDIDKLGRATLWSGEVADCLHQNHVFAIRPALDVLTPEYLVTLLDTQYASTYFIRTAKQTTNLASTNKTTIGNLRLPLPDIAEQARLLQYLDDKLGPLVKSLRTSAHEIALIEEYRTRLISDVVTGQLDVREAEIPDHGHDAPAFDELIDADLAGVEREPEFAEAEL